jgi:pyrroline-5-carboxylate reductase
MLKNNITIIGAGNMGAALLNRIIQKYSKSNKYLMILDSVEEQLNKIDFKNKTTDLNKALDFAEIIVIAVKPQSFQELINQAKEQFKDKILISIMAGVNMGNIKTNTGALKIIRAMPNLALKNGLSLTGVVYSDKVTEKEQIAVNSILNACGEVVELKSEEDIDKITALSGSGPAYFFYFCEIMEQKAKEFGFTKEEARKIVIQTIAGSVSLLKNDTRSFKELKEAVTSKGGTTEAALNYLNENRFNDTFKKAIEKAYKRAQELGS